MLQTPALRNKLVRKRRDCSHAEVDWPDARDLDELLRAVVALVLLTSLRDEVRNSGFLSIFCNREMDLTGYSRFCTDTSSAHPRIDTGLPDAPLSVPVLCFCSRGRYCGLCISELDRRHCSLDVLLWGRLWGFRRAVTFATFLLRTRPEALNRP